MTSPVDAEQAMTIVGTIGGFAISLSLVPQVYLTYKTKCADDISYTYQFIYIFGTALVNAYAIYFGLYAVYIPCLLEFCLIVTLTIMKAAYPPRQDLLDISKHSLMESIRSDGNTAAFNLHILQHMLHHEVSEVGTDGDFDSMEFDKNMLKKSIKLLKRMAVQQGHDAHHHHNHQQHEGVAATETDTEKEESNLDATVRAANHQEFLAAEEKDEESNLYETIHTGHRRFDA